MHGTLLSIKIEFEPMPPGLNLLDALAQNAMRCQNYDQAGARISFATSTGQLEIVTGALGFFAMNS